MTSRQVTILRTLASSKTGVVTRKELNDTANVGSSAIDHARGGVPKHVYWDKIAKSNQTKPAKERTHQGWATVSLLGHELVTVDKIGALDHVKLTDKGRQTLAAIEKAS